ncbi:MAG: prephenate dehydratase domain-containing protein, partial [Candidatus Woesearchaeota archaeon]
MTKVAYFGVPGSYSEIATINAFDENIERVSFSEIDEIFRAVEKRNADYGVVPIENSSAGSINQTYDELMNSKLLIVGEHFQKIGHCLLSKSSSISTIKRVYSHPQALAQCSKFLKKHKFEQLATSNTAESVKYLTDNEKAIIASSKAASIYGLNILSRNIEDDKNNTTRFIIVARHESKKRENCKTSVVFRTKHVPAALYKCLGGFATNGINLTKIESRPDG